jgi:hypothetical protein
MFNILSIYILFTSLYFCILSDQKLFKNKPFTYNSINKIYFISNYYDPKYERQFSKLIHLKLLRSIFFGDKLRLPKKIKKIFKRFNAYHILTPSGLHLSSFMMNFTFFFCIINFFKPSISYKAFTYFNFFIYTFLFYVIYSVSGFYSLKRIILLKFVLLSLRFFFKNLNYFYIFLSVFIYDFLFGTFINSPFSYAYSFFFLGIIFSLNSKPNTHELSFINNFNSIYYIYFNLLLAQYYLCFLINGKFNVLNGIIGLGISIFFNFTFPIISIFFILSVFFKYKFLFFLLDESMFYVIKLIKLLDKV